MAFSLLSPFFHFPARSCLQFLAPRPLLQQSSRSTWMYIRKGQTSEAARNATVGFFYLSLISVDKISCTWAHSRLQASHSYLRNLPNWRTKIRQHYGMVGEWYGNNYMKIRTHLAGIYMRDWISIPWINTGFYFDTFFKSLIKWTSTESFFLS